MLATMKPFCIDFTNSTIDGSVKISKRTCNKFVYSIDNLNYEHTAAAGTTIRVQKGSKLFIKGINTVDSLFDFHYEAINRWVITGDNVKLSGNIQDLISNNAESLQGSCNFAGIFSYNKSIVDASELILPATTLSERCYAYMFNCCDNLIAAPKLNATKLAKYCYYAMFCGCVSLKAKPELNVAKKPAGSCDYMFYGCE